MIHIRAWSLLSQVLSSRKNMFSRAIYMDYVVLKGRGLEEVKGECGAGTTD